MAVAVKSLGLPWIHTDITCSNCQVSPITGYRYKCENCNNHDLCQKCYRLGHTQKGHNFLRIARDSKNFHPPFQVYYIPCDECGQAPIEGRRYHHKWRPNRDLCFDCFSKQPQAAREYEIMEDVKIPTICTTHQPVFHFHKRCGSCGVVPITGPRFDSITYPDYTLCLVCFDTKFVKNAIKNEDFIRIERPEPNKVRQILVYSCMSCGEVPICGPAYVNQRVPEKVYCLLCYMNVPRQVQFEYSRVDPPTQLGDPPAPVVSHQQGSLVSHGSARSEDYAKLAREFEQYKKEREDKDEQAKVMARKFVELNDKFVKQQTTGRPSDAEREKVKRERDEAVLECAKLSDDIERLRKEKEDEAEYATRLYVSRIESLEKQVLESEEAAKTSASSVSALEEELEKLKREKEEEETEFRSLAKDLETSATEKETHAALALEFDKLKEQHLDLTRQFEGLKRKSEEDSRRSAEKYDRLVKERDDVSTKAENEKQELLDLITSLQSSKSDLEEAVRVGTERHHQLEKEHDELTENNAELIEEVEKLKKEISEALENAEQAREVNERAFKVEHSSISTEFEKLKQMHFTLTTEYENLMKEKEEVIEKLDHLVKEHDELAKDHLSLNEEFDEWKQDKGAAEKEWSTRLIELTRELKNLKEQGEAGSALAERYASLETAHRELKEEREEEVRELEEHLRSLQKENSRFREEIQEAATLAAEEKTQLENEVQKLKHEAAEWADLIEQFQRLVKDKEAKLKEVDQILQEKEAEAEEKARDVENLERANDDLVEKYARLKEEFQNFRADQEERLREKETVMSRGLEDQSSISRQLESVKKELAQTQETLKTSRKEFTELSEEFENLEDELKTLQEEVVGHRNLTQNLKKEKSEKENAIAELTDRIQTLEKLLQEKDEALSESASHFKEIDSLNKDLEALAEEKQMAEDNATGIIHELQKQVNKLEKQLKEKEKASSSNAVGKSNSVASGKERNGQVVSKEEFDKLKTYNETIKEELESVREDFAEIFSKYQEMFPKYQDVYPKYQALRSSLPAFLLNTKKGLRCATAAVCCQGVLNEREKASFKEGAERSRSRNSNDPDADRLAEEFMQQVFEELDEKWLAFINVAFTVTDVEAQEFALAKMSQASLDKVGFLHSASFDLVGNVDQDIQFLGKNT
ncbi:hypothetical protein R1sor_018075 [Riccia sorocarpa]|uniref:ZZ-type domain-containing protein n=1 Tax=Riccia sorocarpa TaxID=122646 RepID=A0ABD3I8R1_9MARC